MPMVDAHNLNRQDRLKKSCAMSPGRSTTPALTGTPFFFSFLFNYITATGRSAPVVVTPCLVAGKFIGVGKDLVIRLQEQLDRTIEVVLDGNWMGIALHCNADSRSSAQPARCRHPCHSRSLPIPTAGSPDARKCPSVLVADQRDAAALQTSSVDDGWKRRCRPARPGPAAFEPLHWPFQHPPGAHLTRCLTKGPG